MPRLTQTLEQWIGNCRLAGQPLLVAVSAGGDSMALLHGLLMLRKRYQLQLTVGHVNHRLRGPESDGDAAWLADECARLTVPCLIEMRSDQIPPPASEDSAREFRYAALANLARSAGARAVAVAHTADDQAETVLHQMLRGTGLAGLRGAGRAVELAPGITLHRPLLDVRRATLHQFLKTGGHACRVDSSNADLRFTRNRIRQVVLPMLEEHVHPECAASLVRLAEQARAIYAWLDQQARAALGGCVLSANRDGCELRTEPLLQLPPVLRREVFVQLWKQQNWPRGAMGEAEWAALAALVEGGPAITLPGRLRAERLHDRLVLHWPVAADSQSAPPIPLIRGE